MGSDLILSYSPDTKRLARAFETRDAIGAAVRVHAEVDASIDHVLGILSRWVDHEKGLPRQFGPKLDQLSKFGFPGLRLTLLREFNAIRIELAHGKREVPTDGQIARLQSYVEKAIGRGLKDFELNLTSEVGHKQCIYRDMTNAEKYVFLGALVTATTAAFPEEIRAKLKLAGITLI